MIYLVFLYLFSIASSEKAPPYGLKEGPAQFEDFIRVHGKVYSSAEEKAMRYGIFLMNLELINQLNAENNYTEFGINQFTDLTLEEFRAKNKCFKPVRDYSDGFHRAVKLMNTNSSLPKTHKLPRKVDWREKNVVTRVKDQGDCGSSWAFSIIGNIESANAIKTGRLIELSEQQLVDCDTQNGGCTGGNMEMALRYIMGEGVMTSKSYPYEGAHDTCLYRSEDVAVNLKIFFGVMPEEKIIAEVLAKKGPISIRVDPTPLRNYQSGMINGGMCHARSLDHDVLLVGYGEDEMDGTPYWLVKNSWSEKWGERGYFKMQRGVNCLGFTNDLPFVVYIR